MAEVAGMYSASNASSMGYVAVSANEELTTCKCRIDQLHDHII